MIVNRRCGMAAGLVILAGAMGPASAQSASPDVQQSLDWFVKAAFKRSPELAAGDSSLAASGQQAIAAGKPLYNPSVELDAESGELRTFTAGVSQTLDLHDKREARGGAGQAQLRAARARQAALRQRIAVDALKALAGYDGARRLAALAAESKAVLNRFFKISQRLRKVGEIGAVDLSLARLALANAVRNTANAERQLSNAREALALATRVPKTQWPTLPTAASPQTAALPAINLPDTESEFDRLVLDLPEVQRVQAEVEAAEDRAVLARRQRHADPTVSLRGGAEGSFGLFGLNLSVPLNVRNSFKAEAEAAAYQVEAAKFSAADTRNAARLRLAAARDRYQDARAAAQRWRALAGGRIEKGIELLERLYRSGDLDATIYLTQLREHLDARTAGIELYAAAWQAWFQWLDASGRWRAWLTGGSAVPSAK